MGERGFTFREFKAEEPDGRGLDSTVVRVNLLLKC